MLTPERIRTLGEVLAETHEHEIDCDEFLAHVAALVELRQLGAPLPSALAPVEAHERLCSNCREECAALARVIIDAE